MLIAYISHLDWKREKTTSAMFINPCQRQPGLPRPWFQLKIMKKSTLKMPALKEENISRSGKAKLQLLAPFTLPLGSAWHERGEGKSGKSREVTNRLLGRFKFEERSNLSFEVLLLPELAPSCWPGWSWAGWGWPGGASSSGCTSPPPSPPPARPCPSPPRASPSPSSVENSYFAPQPLGFGTDKTSWLLN